MWKKAHHTGPSPAPPVRRSENCQASLNPTVVVCLVVIRRPGRKVLPVICCTDYRSSACLHVIRLLMFPARHESSYKLKPRHLCRLNECCINSKFRAVPEPRMSVQVFQRCSPAHAVPPSVPSSAKHKTKYAEYDARVVQSKIT
jgi:hypothetical protein